MKDKLLKNKQRFQIIDGGIGAKGCNGKVGIIVRKNGGFITRHRRTIKDRGLYSSPYNGEILNVLLNSENPLMKVYNFHKKKFEYWGLCAGYVIKPFKNKL